jgi:hypothetical protein
MADKLQQTTDDYEGTSGAGVLPKTKSRGENYFTPSGANAAPGEADRYGGKGYAQRLNEAASTGENKM